MSIVTYNNRSIANISAIPGAAESLTHIKTLTASSSATLSFVDGSSDVVLDNTYPIYLIKFISIHLASRSQLTMNLSADTGSNYNVTKTGTLFYSYHKEDDSDTIFEYNTNHDIAQGTGFMAIAVGDNDEENDYALSGELYLFNPSSTTFVKHFMSRINQVHYNDASADNFVAGYGNTTSAVDAIQFKAASGNIDAGTIKLYGLKDS
jgi:hypothetical protein